MKLFIWLHIHHIIWSFWIITSHCEIDAWNFLYFNWWESLWVFGHHTFYLKLLSLFPSQILVCVKAFATHYLFSFGDLHLLSSLSKNNKIKEWEDIYRHKSMHVSRSTKPLTNHSWQVWRSIDNNHIDVKISPTMIWVHREQAMLINAQNH